MNMAQTSEQILQLTISQLRSRYRGTFLGFLWVIANPIFMMAAQVIIFHKILRFGNLNYEGYLMMSLAGWLFFQQTVEMVTGHLRGNSVTIKAFQIPALIFIGAQTLENLSHFIVVFAAVLAWISFHNSVTAFSVIIATCGFLNLAIFAFSLSFITSILNVIYKDVRYILSFILSMTYFMTPIFYELKIVPENLQSFLKLNPLLWLFRPMQNVILSAAENMSALELLAPALSISLFTSLLAYGFWKLTRQRFYLSL